MDGVYVKLTHTHLHKHHLNILLKVRTDKMNFLITGFLFVSLGL